MNAVTDNDVSPELQKQFDSLNSEALKETDFSIGDKGVTLEEKVLVFGPVWIAGESRSQNGENWGILVVWIDRDGKRRERSVPRGRLHEQGPGLAQDLANSGLLIKPGCERTLHRYFGLFESIKRLRNVSSLGWIDTPSGELAFVLPGRVIAKSQSETIVFQPEKHSPTTRTITASGSLEQWRESVAIPCVGNPLPTFALCAGLAGHLLKSADLDSGGFHLFGTTSRGKTTLLQVSASVYGCAADPANAPAHSFIRRWNTTTNGAEGLAAAHNDGPLILDEIGTCTAKDFGALVYNIAGGQGKAAMNSDRSLREARTWRILILSSGEVSARQKIEESGKAVKGGQTLRLIDIPLPADGGFQDTHGMPPGQFADKLKKASSEHYGTASPALIHYLVSTFDDANALRHEIQTQLEDVVELFGKQSSPEQARTIKRFALVAVAGLFAVKAKILPFTPNQIVEAAQFACELWSAGHEGESTDAERGIASVRAFILKNETRFRPKDDSGLKVQNLAGYLDRSENRFLFTDAGFTEACGGNDAKSVARELAARGLLFKNDTDRLKSKHSIDGISDRIGLYAVKSRILNYQDEDSDDE